MLELFKLDHSNLFPTVDLALDEPNGLLAFGGDLSTERLVNAYRSGVFPWFGDEDPYLWWSPDPRGILELSTFHESKSLHKTLRKSQYQVTLNNNFLGVINQCAKIPRKLSGSGQINESSNQTWITQDMIEAYIRMHDTGNAHSIEVWHKQALVGGLYGISVGGVFCGESMFHSKTDASKVALLALVRHMKAFDMGFIDCQMETPHLASLGCKTINRVEFIARLGAQKDREFSKDLWRPQSLGNLF
ncbi:MAG: leucyl/phenylalanyl-tRNA--protein transferase [Glaciecola sp.]|jgi:leucyl/phenylalanyl-tRNA--protein transferase